MKQAARGHLEREGGAAGEREQLTGSSRSSAGRCSPSLAPFAPRRLHFDGDPTESTLDTTARFLRGSESHRQRTHFYPSTGSGVSRASADLAAPGGGLPRGRRAVFRCRRRHGMIRGDAGANRRQVRGMHYLNATIFQ